MRRRAPLLAAGLLSALALSCGGRREATILYVTDAHEISPVVDRWGERGGVARLKTVVDRVKQSRPDALVVFGGDLAGGTLFGGVFRGEPMVDAMGKIGVGLASFGQHEFDFGTAHARRLVARSRFPWIASNLVDPSGAPFAGLPTRVLRRVGGLAVGFIGLTDDMQTTTQDGQVFQRDLVEAARREAAILKREGAEAVVALTQTGAATNDRLLREVPLLDAILTEEESEVRTIVRFAGVRAAAAPCGNIGSVVELRLSAPAGERVRSEVLSHPVDASVSPDLELAGMEKTFTAKLDARLVDPVAVLAETLPSRRRGDVEVALGDLVADAFRSATESQAALVPATSLRADLPAGALTKREVFRVLPFENSVVLLEVPGSSLREVLEKSLSRPDEALVQVSGISYDFDPGARPGARLRSVRVGGEPLREGGHYRVAVSSYLAAGGEGFTELVRAPRLPIAGGEPQDADALEAYLVKLGRNGWVRRPEGGRIQATLR